MEKVLRQSKTAKEELIERLLSTIPHIIERYLTEVPNHHAKLLLTIPQQSALFYNNCAYLSYWLRKNNNKGIESTTIIAQSLDVCGQKEFSRQTQNQRDQMMTILKEFGIFLKHQ